MKGIQITSPSFICILKIHNLTCLIVNASVMYRNENSKEGFKISGTSFRGHDHIFLNFSTNCDFQKNKRLLKSG